MKSVSIEYHGKTCCINSEDLQTYISPVDPPTHTVVYDLPMLIERWQKHEIDGLDAILKDIYDRGLYTADIAKQVYEWVIEYNTNNYRRSKYRTGWYPDERYIDLNDNNHIRPYIMYACHIFNHHMYAAPGPYINELLDCVDLKDHLDPIIIKSINYNGLKNVSPDQMWFPPAQYIVNNRPYEYMISNDLKNYRRKRITALINYTLLSDISEQDKNQFMKTILHITDNCAKNKSDNNQDELYDCLYEIINGTVSGAHAWKRLREVIGNDIEFFTNIYNTAHILTFTRFCSSCGIIYR